MPNFARVLRPMFFDLNGKSRNVPIHQTPTMLKKLDQRPLKERVLSVKLGTLKSLCSGELNFSSYLYGRGIRGREIWTLRTVGVEPVRGCEVGKECDNPPIRLENFVHAFDFRAGARQSRLRGRIRRLILTSRLEQGEGPPWSHQSV